jgi:hypothetical protein
MKSAGENRKKKATHTGDWETTETPLLLQGLGLTHGGGWAKHDWVEDEAVLVTLDLLDHLGLLIGGAVVVNNTETSLESHVDGHVMLSDSVHRRGDKRSLQGDTLGDWGIESYSGSWETNISWKDQKVVVGQTTVLGGVEHGLDIETIPLLVLILEDVQGLGVVLNAAEKLGAGLDVAAGDSHDVCVKGKREKKEWIGYHKKKESRQRVGKALSTG